MKLTNAVITVKKMLNILSITLAFLTNRLIARTQPMTQQQNNPRNLKFFNIHRFISMPYMFIYFIQIFYQVKFNFSIFNLVWFLAAELGHFLDTCLLCMFFEDLKMAIS